MIWEFILTSLVSEFILTIFKDLVSEPVISFYNIKLIYSIVRKWVWIYYNKSNFLTTFQEVL